MTGNQVWEIIAFLAAVVIFIPISFRLKVNPILAFIGAGIVLGPQMLGLIHDTAIVSNIGEVGLLFLMFTIGLDLSFHRFKVMRRYIFGLGISQILMTAFIVGIFALIFDRSMNESIVIGIGLAMSSTAVAMRLMQARGTLSTLPGRASVGILLMQDLAVIPMMVLLPRLAHSEVSVVTDIGASVFKAVGAVALIIIVGRMVMRPLFRVVAATKSSEAFTSSVLLVFLGTAWVTNLAGLSISLGAFLGGMLIAETEFGHEVEAEISSLSNLLLGVFFLSVGLMIDIHYALTHIFIIVVMTLALMFVKAVVIWFLEKRFDIPEKGAASSAIVLSQVGEFGFVIFGMASQKYNLISHETSSLLQVVIALSMVLTPFVLSFAMKRLEPYFKSDDKPVEIIPQMADEDESYTDHILLVGYGRVGQTAARMLERNGLSFVIIDSDVQRIEDAIKEKRKFIFGNAANQKILNTANISQAKAMIIAVGGVTTASYVLAAAREISRSLPVYVRCDDPSRWPELMQSGANGAIAESLECGIRLGACVVLSLGGEEQKIKDIATILRQENTVNVHLPTAEAAQESSSS